MFERENDVHVSNAWRSSNFSPGARSQRVRKTQPAKKVGLSGDGYVLVVVCCGSGTLWLFHIAMENPWNTRRF